MATVTLRCDGPTIHGRATDATGTFEAKCKRRRCGHQSGSVVLHTFDLATGQVVRTSVFAEPKNQKGQGYAPDNSPAAVRAS